MSAKDKITLLDNELNEYRKRADRQPTEMSHQYRIGERLFQKGEIDAAAAAFQKSVQDGRFQTQVAYLPRTLFLAQEPA